MWGVLQLADIAIRARGDRRGIWGVGWADVNIGKLAGLSLWKKL
jgi:hypothetical protein